MHEGYLLLSFSLLFNLLSPAFFDGLPGPRSATSFKFSAASAVGIRPVPTLTNRDAAEKLIGSAVGTLQAREGRKGSRVAALKLLI